MTTGGEHVDEDAIDLKLQPWAHPGEAKLYVNAEYEEELRELLTAAGISNGRVYEFHLEPLLAAVLIGVSTPAAWKALATVIPAFLERNKDKTVKVSLDGEQVELRGYPIHDVERLMDRMARRHDEGRQKWDKMTGRSEPPGELESKP